MRADPLVSIVVPVFNEADSVDLFLTELRQALLARLKRAEVIFVNDGSTDGTEKAIERQIARDRRIRVITLSRNFGKEAALTAGLDHASGDVVVPMDVDLQDPPSLVLKFLEKWHEGYDVVYGVRESRKGDTPFKRLTARLFYRSFRRLSPLGMPQDVGDFRLMDRKVVEAMKLLPERNRFMKGLFAWVGFTSIGVGYERVPRVRGTSSWSFWKLWNFALDGLFSFSTAPLRTWTYIGLFLAVCAFLYGLYIILHVFFLGIDVPGYASLITFLLFFSGLQLISLGIIGEYVGRLFLESKRRPIYIVSKTRGGPRRRKKTAGGTSVGSD